MEETENLVVFIHTRIAQMVFQSPKSLILCIPTQRYFFEVSVIPSVVGKLFHTVKKQGFELDSVPSDFTNDIR